MIDEKIKIKFGNSIIECLTEFARTGIPDSVKMDTTWFEHVQEKAVREALCDTFYGARWHYKVGLALLVQKQEQYAHVRAQVVDYASICETLLAEMLIHGVTNSKFTGSQYLYSDFQKKRPLKWVTNQRKTVEKQTFAWYIKVAEEEKIIDAPLVKAIEKIRVLRNTVHITERAKRNNSYSLQVSDEAFKTMQQTINQTKKWYNKNK